MRIVSKINLALVGVVGISALLNLAALELTVMPSFFELEDTAARRNQSRVLEAIGSQEAQVASSSRDYGFWDDSFAFMKGEKADYIEKNVNSESIKALSLNYLVILDRDGTVVLDNGYQFSGDEPKPLRLMPSDAVAATDPLLAPFVEPGSRTGLVRTGAGFVAVGYAPILTSERTGPAMGTLLFGRILDIAALQDQTKVDFELLPVEAETSSSVELIRSDEAIEVRSVVSGLGGLPIATLVSRTGRSVSAAGRQAVWAAMVLLILGGLVLIAALAFVLRHIAIKRVGALRDHLSQVGSTGQLAMLPEDGRGDELSETIVSFNRMASQLADLRESLRRQDYHHGAADQAAGILHNVRNAISPIGTIAWDLTRREEAPWKRNLAKALDEIADPMLPAERAGKLHKFVAMSTAKLLEEGGTRHADLQTLTAMVRHVDEILKEEDVASKGQRVVERIDLSTSIASAAKLISGKEGIELLVKVEPDAAVVGHRIAFEQILGNLLVNSAEAIHATGRGHGRIEIEVAELDTSGTTALAIMLRDDGEGIEPGRLETIFEKGYSTRRDRSGGTGLHWCANAVGAMNGRLFARSEGPGRGATLHLILPRYTTELKDAA